MKRTFALALVAIACHPEPSTPGPVERSPAPCAPAPAPEPVTPPSEALWFDQLCAPEIYALDEPLVRDDGRRVVVCDERDPNLVRPRQIRIVDTATGEDVYRRFVGTSAEVASVGRELARFSWKALPRLGLRHDPVAAARAPTESAPFLALESVLMATGGGIEVSYREPLLVVRTQQGSLLEERIETWSYGNESRPSDPGVRGYSPCTGFILTHLGAAWGDSSLGFIVVLLRRQGGAPACSRTSESPRVVPLPSED